jgi:hypothetical protein
VFHCTPHPGLGSVVVRRVRVDLATCATSPAPPLPKSLATVRVTKDSQSIVFAGKVVLRVHESHKGFPAGSPGPIELEGVSPDEKWILYAIDPMGSASLAADGLTLRAVSVATGRSRTVAGGLMYDDYRAWCGTRLVMTAGGDRIAIHDKRLIVTQPPGWQARPLVSAPSRAFGSLACDGNGVIVQSQAAGGVNDDEQAFWSLWRVGTDGSMTRLTKPPRGDSDDSPHTSPDGRIVYFVRSRRDVGALYALRGGRVVGPLLQLGADRSEYFGHREWPYGVVP